MTERGAATLVRRRGHRGRAVSTRQATDSIRIAGIRKATTKKGRPPAAG